MPKIKFLPQNIEIEAEANALLLEAARLAGVSVETPCGGKGICRKCLVKIIDGAVESNAGSYRNAKENHFLICQTNILNEDVTVEILAGLYGEDGQFDDVGEAVFFNDFKIDALGKYIELTVAKPAPLDGFSDLDRLEKALNSRLEFADLKIPLNVLQDLPIKLRESESIRLFYYFDGGILNITEIINSEENNMPQKNYGVAVDIGTTTVTLWLADLDTGAILSRKTDYNMQIECGLDVITRINYAQKHLSELRERVLRTINGLVKIVCGENNINCTEIRAASIAGNTVMTHLFLGIYPEHIRLDPYTPAIYKSPLFNARELLLDINPNAPIKIAPAVGSYVGGDITAGALNTPLIADKDEIILFFDIGTNGEILLGNNEFILGCACSAGPAFEGGGIEFGMRASRGAIDGFKIDGENINITTIDNAPPVGICGSGIIAAVAELFRHKIIDAVGRFTDKMPERIKKDKKPYKFYITENISISEADIDNLIRAKGAMFSACRTLLNNIGLEFGDIKKIYIAGGFGKYLNIADAVTIGLLPNVGEDTLIYLGNSSITGAYQTLLSGEKCEQECEIAEKITYIDLSGEAGYMDEYLAALFLPHTDLKSGGFTG